MRCIKPNNEQAQEDYDAALVLHQLRCCGITEVARIARAGYPTRYAHQQFAQRYSSLLGNRVPRKPFAHPLQLSTCGRSLYPLTGESKESHAGIQRRLNQREQPVLQRNQGFLACHQREICALAGRGEPVLETCQQLLSKFGVKPEQYQIGRTKLFFRAGVLGQLEDAATRINK